MKIAVFGYGNLGKGVELAVKRTGDASLFGVFTRRDPKTVKTLGAKVYSADSVLKYTNDIDVMIICGGSATDLPKLTPQLSKYFNTVDSFDTHADIPKHFENVDKAAKEGNKTALISAGWDPGMFSLARLYSASVLPDGKDYTFWGKGVSQGHSDAIRRIEGVIDARQYTCPVESALLRVRNGEDPELSTREKHTRLCYVVAKDDADKERIEREIKTMPKYFADYDTTVHFISEDEMRENHSGIPHGGMVIRTGRTGQNDEHRHIIEYSLKLDSNPEFTASVLIAYARAVNKLANRGNFGCKTVFDIAPANLSELSPEQLRAKML